MSNPLVLQGSDGKTYPIPRDGMLTIGSSGDDILISTPGIAAAHVTIIVAGSRVMVKPGTDAASLDGQPLDSLKRMEVGSVLTIGGLDLQLAQAGTSVAADLTSSSQTHNAPRSTSGRGLFDLGEAMFADPPLPAAPVPITPPPAPRVPPSVPPVPSPVTPSASQPAPPTRPAPLSNADYRRVLAEFFDDAYIYSDSKSNTPPISNPTGMFGKSVNLMFAAANAISEHRRKQPRPAGYVDEAIRQAVQAVIDVARREVNMDSTVREPLVIYGPIFWRASGLPLKVICARKGDDGYMRFSAQKVSVLLLDEEEIGTYTAYLDTINQQINRGETHIYSYDDITSITDTYTTEQIELDDGVKPVSVYSFRIAVPGDDLTIALNSPVIRDMFGADASEQPEHKESLKVIRTLWRDKKRGK